MSTLFNTLMTRTEQRLLQQYHYPDDLEWRWSLGYCWPWLTVSRWGGEVRNALTLMLTQHPVAVSLTQGGLRYTHAECIQAEIHDFPDTEDALYQTFYQALRQDLGSLCSEAERQGYQLLDATLPPHDNEMLFERRTRHFALRAIAETNDDGLDYSEDASSWDKTLDLLLEHGARLLSLRLELVCLTTGDTLAQDWPSTVLIAANQPVRQWFDREVLPELMHTARDAIEQKRRVYQAIRSAA